MMNVWVVGLIVAGHVFAADELPSLGAGGGGATQRPIEKQSVVEGDPETHALGSRERQLHIYPMMSGQAGVFRTRSAESLPEGSLSFGIAGEFYAVNNGPDFGLGPSAAETIAESLFVSYAPIRSLTLSVMRHSSSTTFAAPGNQRQLISSLGDFTFGASYSFPISPVFSLAPFADLLVSSNFNNLAPAGTTVSTGFGLASTLSLYPLSGLPWFFHLNAGYYFAQVRSTTTGTLQPEAFFHFYRYDQIKLALATEYRLGDFTPFVELTDTVPLSSGVSFTDSPSRLGAGIRMAPFTNKGLAITLGADLGLGKGLRPGVAFNPDYQVLGMASYTFGLTSTERQHYFATQDVRVVDRRFVIGKTIEFKVGSSELLPESNVTLDQIAQVIQENNIRKLLIVGHTDSSHNEDYNLKLSLDRATSVKRYLVTKGIADETFMVQGYGKRKPRASNFTEEGRKENRRVEFFIID